MPSGTECRALQGLHSAPAAFPRARVVWKAQDPVASPEAGTAQVTPNSRTRLTRPHGEGTCPPTPTQWVEEAGPEATRVSRGSQRGEAVLSDGGQPGGHSAFLTHVGF